MVRLPAKPVKTRTVKIEQILLGLRTIDASMVQWAHICARRTKYRQTYIQVQSQAFTLLITFTLRYFGCNAGFVIRKLLHGLLKFSLFKVCAAFLSHNMTECNWRICKCDDLKDEHCRC